MLGIGTAGGTFGPEETIIDGVNLRPFINGANTTDPHDVLVHRWRSTFAVIKGYWKLINTTKFGADPSDYKRYNAKSDLGETNDLIGDPQYAGRGKGRQIGPSLTAEARVRILAQIQSATDSGASVVCGGMPPEPAMSGFYLEPTILRDVRRDMEPSGDESIGPVLP